MTETIPQRDEDVPQGPYVHPTEIPDYSDLLDMPASPEVNALGFGIEEDENGLLPYYGPNRQ